MVTRRMLYVFILLLITIFFAGCQPKVLMPLPVGVKPGEDFFDWSQDAPKTITCLIVYHAN